MTYSVGILGGGQLGRMLCQAAANLDIYTTILDEELSYPAAVLCNDFLVGSFKDYNDVMLLDGEHDVITIEIEHVNTDALRALKETGKKVHPDPDILDIIKDKGLQKAFYVKNNLPTAPFSVFTNEEELIEAIEKGEIKLPFVQKTTIGGYDGYGVKVIKQKSDLKHFLIGSCVVEPLIDIAKELAVIVARNENGEIAVYPSVEMDFHATANMVSMIKCPSDIDEKIELEAQDLAKKCIETFGLCGLLAVEFFLTKDNELLINEVAPRPHNSGHLTIEACYTSQFEQHLRAVLNLPLGSTKLKAPASVMVNILGEHGHKGKAIYEGLEECLKTEGSYIHLYGKSETKANRKMGHITCIADDMNNAIEKASHLQKTLKVISNHHKKK